MKFEEQFPGLKGKEHEKVGFMTFYNEITIQENCIDKQEVGDLLDYAFRSLWINEHYYKLLKKELGL